MVAVASSCCPLKNVLGTVSIVRFYSTSLIQICFCYIFLLRRSGGTDTQGERCDVGSACRRACGWLHTCLHVLLVFCFCLFGPARFILLTSSSCSSRLGSLLAPSLLPCFSPLLFLSMGFSGLALSFVLFLSSFFMCFVCVLI